MARKDSQSSAESEEDWNDGGGSDDDDDDETDDGSAEADEDSLIDAVAPVKAAKAIPAPLKAAKVPSSSLSSSSSSAAAAAAAAKVAKTSALSSSKAPAKTKRIVIQSDDESDNDALQAAPAPTFVAISNNASASKKGVSLNDSESDDDCFIEEVKENKDMTNKQPVASTKSPPSAKKQATTTVAASTKTVSSLPSSSSNIASTSSSSAAPTSTSNVDITRGPNITTESRAKEVILQYMRQQNRPYSAIQVYDNLHHRISKPFVDKALTALSEGESSQLLMKQYGKASIFFYNQLLIPSIKPGEMEKLESDIAKLKNIANERAARVGTLTKALGDLTQEPTDDDLDAVVATLQSRVREKQTRVNKISTCHLDPNALQNANRALVFFRTEYRKRKENCMDIVETLAENMNKKTKVVMNDLGLDVDE